jgi:hypothetical protein
MSQMGQTLHIQGVRVMSAIHPIATEFRHCALSPAPRFFFGAPD